MRYRGMQADRWDHTAALQSTIIAIAGGECIDPDDLNPYRENEKPDEPPVTAEEAKETAREIREMIRARKS